MDNAGRIIYYETMKKRFCPERGGVVEEADLDIILNVLSKGGILLYPTDTLYGLGVDALNSEAVDRLFLLKGRPRNRPVAVMVQDLRMANDYVVVTERAHRLAECFLPGPLTIILEARQNMPHAVLCGGNSLAIRIPKHPFCEQLSAAFPHPITSTSANVSDQTPASDVDGILAQFGSKAGNIDLIIDEGVVPGTPSTIVDISTHEIKIVREGAIPSKQIIDLLR